MFCRFVAIDGITENRSAEVFEVDTELVGAAGGGFQLKQGVFIVLGEDFVISLGRFAVLANFESGGAFQVASDREVNHRFGEFRVAFDDGVVSFVSFAILELLAEHGLGLGVFREDDDAAGVAVEAMDEQAIIFEGGLGAVFALCHAEEAGGLVDDKDVVVFVDHGRTGRKRGSGGNFEDYFGGAFELRVRLRDNFAVDGDVAGFDELLEAGAVIFGMLLDEEMIEALAGVFGGAFGQDCIPVDDAREAGFAELFAGDNHFIIPCFVVFSSVA